MKRILFVLPSINDGGAERVMLMVAKKAAESHEIYFALTKDNIVKYPVDKNISLIVNNGDNSPKGQILFIRKIIKQKKINLCISFLPKQNLYSIIASLFTKCKVMLSIRNDPKTEFSNKNLEKLSKILYKKTSKIIFQTNDARDCFSGNIRKNGEVIFNPLTSNLPNWSGVESKTFITAARLNKQKNIPLMISSFIKVHECNPEYDLKIYGDGPEYDNLQQIIDLNNASSYIKLMGRNTDIFNVMKESFCFLLTSDFEGMSNSMIEALAIGMPSICSDCRIGAPKMFIKDGVNGFLFEVGNESELIEKMKKVIDLKENGNVMDISYNARTIRDLLDQDKILEKWISVIDSL